jgi:hypothetical protein
MPPRDTTTGGVLEAMILPALTRGGYAYLTNSKSAHASAGANISSTLLPKKKVVGISFLSSGNKYPERRNKRCDSK